MYPILKKFAQNQQKQDLHDQITFPWIAMNDHRLLCKMIGGELGDK